MIREYADGYIFHCDHCGCKIQYAQVVYQDERDTEHFCNDHDPACIDCGEDLTNCARHPADDARPDGQPAWDWVRCDRCHAIAHDCPDTLRCPPTFIIGDTTP